MNDVPEGLLARGSAAEAVDAPATRPLAPSLEAVERAVARGADALLRAQRPDGHWVFELEADATIPAEYVLLRHFLGEPDADGIEARMGNYLRRVQGRDGGWPLFHGGASDLSATVKAYFALKMIGDDPDAPHMARAREVVLARGGAGCANVFTRILLALYEQLPWRGVPTVPAELILLPRSFPVHLSKMSYWARTVLVPLLVLMALPARAKNPRGIGVPELIIPGRLPRPAGEHQQPGWAAAFAALDTGLKVLAPLWPRGSRQRAIERCVAWVTERLNGEDGLGAIYPAMANTVMMFAALGYAPDHPDAAVARRAVEKLLVHRQGGRDDEAYCQPCVSPVWDTALVAHAMLEVGGERATEAARRGLDWLRPLQELEARGDWAEARPEVRPGGWAFQYRNAHYPDLDDTAVVVMAMDRLRRDGTPDYDEAVARGAEWTGGLQSTNGGWGAFDADNVHHYLNNIPFADHGALLDPPTSDVTARCVGMFAQLGEDASSPRMRAALDYLAREQEADGSWFGRWGVNHLYGTWSVLCALNAAGLDGSDPMVRRAADWLVSVQNDDGGWGEGCESYRLDRTSHEPYPSTASQTAWALLGLMAAGEVDHPAVARGIEYLRATQDTEGLWPQDAYTGGGFPRVFYLRYHGYPRFFPLWAMARYRNLRRGNTARVAYGV